MTDSALSEAITADEDAPSRLAESDDRYPAVAVLNGRYRVIECGAGIQWILQRRGGERHGRARWDASGPNLTLRFAWGSLKDSRVRV
jgi:hypothetical protein